MAGVGEMFLLQDGRSVARVFEVRDVATDSRPQAMIDAFHEKNHPSLITNDPHRKTQPWVVNCLCKKKQR